jgi:hypothetical protein
MEKKELAKIRSCLGKTQKQMAQSALHCAGLTFQKLGISPEFFTFPPCNIDFSKIIRLFDLSQGNGFFYQVKERTMGYNSHVLQNGSLTIRIVGI